MLVVILIVVVPFALFIWADKSGKAKKKKKALLPSYRTKQANCGTGPRVSGLQLWIKFQL